MAVPRLFGVARRHPRLGTRLAQGAQDLWRSREGSDEQGPRPERRGLPAAARSPDQVLMPRPRVVVFGYGSLALRGLATLEDLGVTPAAVVIPGNRSGADVDIVAAEANAKS